MDNKDSAIGFTKAGDVTLAYQVVGEGKHPLVFVTGFVSHLEIAWEGREMAGFFNALAQHFTLILFDKRGVGLSERVNTQPSLEDTAEDIQAIMNALNLSRVSIMGASEGGPAALLFAATHPKKVDKLILYGTMPMWIRSYDYPWALSRDQYDRWLENMLSNWGQPESVGAFAPSKSEDAPFKHWWARLVRSGCTPDSMRLVLQAMREIDVRPLLSHIQAATLILHKRGDKAVPIEGGRFLAKTLAQAEFHELKGHDHWWWTEEYSPIIRAIVDFFDATSSATSSLNEHPPQTDALQLDTLTSREKEILGLMATGYSNQQIADELFLSHGTVKTYASSIYSKLNAANRTSAIATGRKLGLLD